MHGIMPVNALLSALFPGLTPESLALMEPLFEIYACTGGTVLFRAGEPAEYFYILQQGAVTIRYKPYDGPTIDLATIRAGGALGWSAVVGNPTYTSDAVAKDDLIALRLRGERLRELVRTQPRAGKKILEYLARLVSARWQNADQQVHEVLSQSMRNSNAVRKGQPKPRKKEPAPK